MKRPVSAWVGLRYLRTQRSNQFASFVTIASVIGVALGVAALIVVLSVMNGFENELRQRLTSITGHAWVSQPGGVADWRRLRDSALAEPGIEAASPVIEIEAILARGPGVAGALLTGALPDLEAPDSPLRAGIREGSLDSLVPGSRAILLGDSLAARLGVRTGDTLNVLVPTRTAGRGLQSRLWQFTVVGLFELGVKDHDGLRALLHLRDAADLAGMGDRVAGLRLTTTDIFDAPGLARSWAARQPTPPEVRDWTEDHATYFRAVQIEKLMMMLLLSLIIAVAAFNIVATLVMVVTDKRGSIAILRTLGCSRGAIIRIFAVQGLAIGWLGVAAGVASGVLLALNIGTVAPWLEAVFGFQFMPGDVYYMTALPSELRWMDVATIGVLALVLTGFATIYPASRAAVVAPAEVLRYE
ncbi:MAG: lipoprotein-releasing ABC transporter permease subunit [Gammaproteobacteria bacterium]|nr:lipoprotein-releasing ABC transporter permease subunit [Gammaproteobacteria bacterium]